MHEVVIEGGTLDDYKRLSGFHYLGARTGSVRAVFRAVRRGELCGAIVYVASTSHPLLKGRNRAVSELIQIYRKYGMRTLMRCLSRDFVRIARVVVYPKYRDRSRS